MRCEGCGLVYINPRPVGDKLEDAYKEQGYDPFLSLSDKPSLFEKVYRSARKQTIRWKKRLVRKLVTPGSRILDIGCGTGEFLFELKNQYSVEGYEPEPGAASWARERFGLNVHTGDVPPAIYTSPSFDLITLWHVLEHIPDPSGALNDLEAKLSSKGCILIALPNLNSLDARIYRSQWIAYDAPRHLWHFGNKQLIKLARNSGLKLVKSGMMPLDTFYNILLSEQMLLNMKGKIQLLLSPFRVPFAVLLSLGFGVLTGQHSSNYYIFRKG